VPLIALFEGLHCNEACQLYTEDIKEANDIAFIAVRKEREDGTRCEKRLKNQPATRNVPIHPMLLRLGFMDFVKRRRRDTASARLFPDLPLGKTGRYSNPFSKWFARFLRSIFEDKAGATFHSFRHHFRDALRARRVGLEAVEQLGGWKSKASQEREYGEGIPLKILREDIAKIKYPSLDLSHLYRSLNCN
jgi:integrase